MATGRGGAAVRQIQVLYSVGAFGALSDMQLLDRFTMERGEAAELAFAVLVERHGPMVLHACRAVLGNEHEAQDAFQATFLVLARRSRSLRATDTLGPWLYEVARRIALSARGAAARRRRHERHAAELTPLIHTVIWRDFDLEQSLHDEIGRLPERYRVPVVLCLLEGLTHEQAARHLGWPVGTVKSRLAGGRERLRSRLSRRGLVPGVLLPSTSGSATSAQAAVPKSLAEVTAQAAARIATGAAAAGVIPASVAALAAGVERSRLMFKAFLMTVAGLALWAFGFAPLARDDRPVTGVRFSFVDLQPSANHRRADALGDLSGNNLASMPDGPQRLAGTWFKIGEKLIRVRGERSSEPPEAVRMIAIGARFDTLHILQSTMFGNAFGADDGTEIGAYIVRYADQTVERIPIIYGADVRDWWRSGDEAEPSRAKMAWAGTNPAAGEDDQIRLFSSEWQNPHPGTRVVAIDFESKNTVCAPFLVALTLERVLRGPVDNAGR
jgi:RNA polymerase sigma factor (sigma-70 family)